MDFDFYLAHDMRETVRPVVSVVLPVLWDLPDESKRYLLRPEDVLQKLLAACAMEAGLLSDGVNIEKIPGSRPPRSSSRPVFIHLLTNGPDLLRRDHLRRVNVDGEIIELGFDLVQGVLALAEIDRKLLLLFRSDDECLPPELVAIRIEAAYRASSASLKCNSYPPHHDGALSLLTIGLGTSAISKGTKPTEPNRLTMRIQAERTIGAIRCPVSIMHSERQ